MAESQPVRRPARHARHHPRHGDRGHRAWHASAAVLGLPSCGTYAHTYRCSSGTFLAAGDHWTEVGGTDTFAFCQLHRDKEYITLLNLTPRKGYRTDMLVRLPACGGASPWTLETPQHWIDLYEVWRA